MKKRDFILIGGILLFALAALLAVQLSKEPGAYVIVRVDGEETARYSLSQTLTVDINGGTNTLHIESGKAWLTQAQCPDHLCVKRGVIDEAGETITCLPNRVTVTVYGTETGVDLVA